jgi:hypothetical protein
MESTIQRLPAELKYLKAAQFIGLDSANFDARVAARFSGPT